MNTSSSNPSVLRIALLAIVATSLAGIGVMHIHRRHQVIQLGYQLSDTNAELTKLEEESRKLTLELSMLTNPERIQALASAMGLVRPSPDQVRTMRPKALAIVP